MTLSLQAKQVQWRSIGLQFETKLGQAVGLIKKATEQAKHKGKPVWSTMDSFDTEVPVFDAAWESGAVDREVLDLLGPPTEPLDLAAGSVALKVAGTGLRWRDGRRRLEVYFINGRVAATVNAKY